MSLNVYKFYKGGRAYTVGATPSLRLRVLNRGGDKSSVY